MIKHKILALAIAIPMISGCGGSTSDGVKDDVKKFTPNLPEVSNKNVGDPITDESGNVLFDFYELSDFHGAAEYNYDSDQLGINRLSSYFTNKRELNPGGTVLTSSGDQWQGTADSNLTYGNLITYAMNIMEFDAMALGNHEFDWGVGEIENNKERSSFPFLAANLYMKGTKELPNFASEYNVVERGDYKIGIVGTIGEDIKDTIIASAVSDFDFGKEIEAVDRVSTILREQEECDIVVWNSHNDGQYLIDIMNKDGMPDVDVVFGGHSHVDFNNVTNGVPVLATQPYGESVAHVQLALDPVSKDVSVVTQEINTELVKLNLPEDKDVKMVYDQYLEKFINPVKNIEIGNLVGDLTITDTLGNLTVEAMMKATTKMHPEVELSAVFHNQNGGIRNDIKSGVVSMGEIYKSFPFDNEIVILEVSGYYLQSYLNMQNMALWQDIDISSIESKTKYYIATTDYLSTKTEGGFIYHTEGATIYTKINVRECVANYMLDITGGGGCAAASIKASNYTTADHPQFSI